MAGIGIGIGVVSAVITIVSLAYSIDNANDMQDKQDEMVEDSRQSATNDMIRQKEMSKINMEEMAVQVGKKLLDNKRLKRQASKLSHDLNGASASQVAATNSDVSTTGNTKGALV